MSLVKKKINLCKKEKKKRRKEQFNFHGIVAWCGNLPANYFFLEQQHGHLDTL